MKKLIFVALAISIIFHLSSFIPASAQTEPDGLDLTVSPPVFDITAQPGQEVRESFRIRNNQTADENLAITVRRLISDPTTGSPIPENESTGDELEWISFSDQSFTARAREWTDIAFTIDVPESAAYGYYYAISIAPAENVEQSETGATVRGEILVVVLLNVKKAGAVANAELIEFKPQKFINEYLPVTFESTLTNNGNVHVKPRGNIFISRGEGKEIAVLEVNEATGSILPEGTRTFMNDWTDGFIVREPMVDEANQAVLDENGDQRTRLVIHWNKLTEFRIGPYTANLVLVYDDGERDQIVEGVTTFWVIPYTVIAISAVTLIVLFFIIRFVLRWYIRRELTKRKR